MPDILIFLDFDGVTHPVSANNKYFRHDCIQSIYSAINLYNAKIVITSTWRLDMAFDQMVEHLGTLGTYVVDCTPEINEPFIRHVRQLEVEKYLSENNLRRVPWIAIDDNAAFYRDDAPVLIVNGRKGFSLHDVQPLKDLIDKVALPLDNVQ